MKPARAKSVPAVVVAVAAGMTAGAVAVAEIAAAGVNTAAKDRFCF